MMRSSSAGMPALTCDGGSGRLGQQALEDRRDGRPLERQLAGGHLVEHDAGGEQIAARVDLLAARLLRRHVRHGADGGADRRQLIRSADRGVRIRAAGLVELGDAEIEHLDRAASRHEQVRGLDVAMHDALRVSGVERIGQLRAELEHFVERQPAARDAILQRLPVEQLHHHELLAALRADVVEGADVRVIEARDHLRFALEALVRVGVGVGLVGQELDRHLAAEARVFRFVDDAHAAGAEPRQDLVVRNGLADHSDPVSGSSRTSRIFFASCIGVNGFCRNGLPSSSTPVLTIASSM